MSSLLHTVRGSLAPEPGWFSRAWLVVFLAAVPSLGGCGGARNYPVKGKVTYKDSGRPLSGGFVMFQLASDASVQASGDLEEDGSYELGNSRGMGAIPGDYEVTVQPKMLEDNPNLLPIDPRFTDFKTSGLSFTVKPGNNQYDIQVERNPRRKK